MPPDPYADPDAETSGWKQWTGLLQRATSSGQNSAKRTQKHLFYFHPNLHTQEVTVSSSVVSTKPTLSESFPHRGRVRICCLSGQYQRIKKAAPVTMTGAAPVMYAPAGVSIPQTPLALLGWRRSPGGMEAKHGPLCLLQSLEL